MAKPPFFPFYPNDWLSSTAVAQMTLEEQGAYLNLLCHQWADPSCTLPMDPGILCYLSRLADRWAECGPKILRLCFTRRGSRIFNERLRDERKKYDGLSERGRNGGVKSGQSRRKHIEQDANQTRTKPEAKPNHSEVRSQKSEVRNETTGILEFYNRVTGRRLTPATQEKFIGPRLDEGVSPHTLRLAVVGACLNPFHLGKNDRNAVYLDPETIFRPARLDGHAEHARHATFRISGADDVWQFWMERLKAGRLGVMRHFFIARDEALRAEGGVPLGPPAAYGSEYRAEDEWPESA